MGVEVGEAAEFAWDAAVGRGKSDGVSEWASGLIEEMERREGGMGEEEDGKGLTSLDHHVVMHQHCPCTYPPMLPRGRSPENQSSRRCHLNCERA